MTSLLLETQSIHTIAFGIDAEKHESMQAAVQRILKSKGIENEYVSMLTWKLGELAQILTRANRVDIVHLFNEEVFDEESVPIDAYHTGCIAIADAIERRHEPRPWVVLGTPELRHVRGIFHTRDLYVQSEALAEAVLKRISRIGGIARCA